MIKLFRFFVMLFLVFTMYSCATVNRVTDMGGSIGESFQKSADKGEVSGDTALNAWPYAHGIIKGLMGPNYDLEINPTAKKIMNELDRLSALPPEELTSGDKGYILGALCRLESVAIEQSWNRFGVSMWRLITK